MMIAAALFLILVIVLVERRRWPERKRDIAKSAELEADANDALKQIGRIAKQRARSMSIPVPVMGPEDTTDVIALHPHRRVNDRPADKHQHKRTASSPYRIVAARARK